MPRWTRSCRRSSGRSSSVASELAEALGLERLQASALITRGSATAMARGSVDDLRRGIEIAERAKVHSQLFRGLNNLGEWLSATGDIVAHEELYARMRRDAEQLGLGNQLLWFDGQECGWRYMRGHWGRALDLANSLIALAEAGKAQYHEADARWVRALIRYGRDDVAGALADAERAAAAARAAHELQAIAPALCVQSLLLACEGRRSAAAQLLDEVLALGETRMLPYFATPSVLWAAVELGREADVEPVMRRGQESPWRDAAAAGCAGDFVEARAIFARLGLESEAAAAAVHAAAHLLERGDRAGANEQLAAAQTFYRQVGATRLLRTAEALLAATA